MQLPLTDPSIDSRSLLNHIDPIKDVDGYDCASFGRLHTVNVGKLTCGQPYMLPCTPSGIVALLDHHKIPLQGSHAVILGRSAVVVHASMCCIFHRDAPYR